MKKKNNKGFTLIELLVAVAVMLSLLGIAIVNFINISDKKKEESWESVKSQIETAAEQYFKSNEYLFEGLTTTGGNITGTISLGKLVNEDYLNAVTDPRTGKMVSYCTKVNVTRTSNGVFTIKIDEPTTKIDDRSYTDTQKAACDTNASLVLSETGAPKLTVTGSGNTTNSSGWFTGDVTITATVEEDGNGTIVNFKKCGDTSECIPNNEIADKEKDEQTHTSETYGYEYCYSATNAKGKTTKACYSFKIDKTAPTLTVGLYERSTNVYPTSSKGLNSYTNNTWYSGWAYTEATPTDNLSGIVSTTYTTTGTTTNVTDNAGTKRNIDAEGTSYITYTTCDKAGNCTSSSTNTIKLDRTAPKFDVGLYKKTNTNNVTSATGLSNYTSGDWYNKGVFTKAMNRNDGKDSKGVNMSGIDTTTYTTTGAVGSNSNTSGEYYNINAEGTSTIQYTVCDKAENCTSSSANTIKLDITAPTLTVGLYKRSTNVYPTSSKGLNSYTNNTWYNGWAYTEATPTDNLSGIVSTTYTTTGTTTNVTDNAGKKRNIDAEGTSYITYTTCDKAGNCTSSSTNTIKLDRTIPSCSISVSGKKGNKVGSLQWYIPDDYVTVDYTFEKNDNYSGIVTSVFKKGNSEINGVSSKQYQTASVTYSGEVEDAAGNSNECSKTFAVETSATIKFLPADTNNALSYNPGKDSDGKKVFPGNNNTCGFDTCSTINCTTDGSTKCAKQYFAKGCMYVNTYYRVFELNAISVSTSAVTLKAEGDNPISKVTSENDIKEGMNRINKFRYGCTLTSKYNVYSCGNATGGFTNATAHEYVYVTPAGRKTNTITLYVEYGGTCGYSSY